MKMPKQFNGFGVSFLYPDNWRITDEQTDNDSIRGLTLESPVGAFFSITRYSNTSNVDEMMANAQSAMEEEYEEIETDEFEVAIGDRILTGVSQSFYYLDLLITSKLLAFTHEQDLFMIQIQGEDRDLDQLESVFQAMMVSLFRSLNQARTEFSS